MSLLRVITERRSIRKYLPKPIPEEVLGEILDAGRMAPSAGNKQPWRFIVVRDQKIREALAKGRYNTFLREAPVAIVGCGYMGTEYGRKWSTVDTAIAMQNMVLATWSIGVGSCWVGDFVESDVKRLLGIPEEYRVVALLSLGYPAESPGPRPRKPLNEIVSYDRF
jgi:nitroreductase